MWRTYYIDVRLRPQNPGAQKFLVNSLDFLYKIYRYLPFIIIFYRRFILHFILVFAFFIGKWLNVKRTVSPEVDWLFLSLFSIGQQRLTIYINKCNKWARQAAMRIHDTGWGICHLLSTSWRWLCSPLCVFMMLLVNLSFTIGIMKVCSSLLSTFKMQNGILECAAPFAIHIHDRNSKSEWICIKYIRT